MDEQVSSGNRPEVAKAALELLERYSMALGRTSARPTADACPQTWDAFDNVPTDNLECGGSLKKNPHGIPDPPVTGM